MSEPMTIERHLKITRLAKGAKKVTKAAVAPRPVALGRIPRIAKLMALAIRWEGLLRDGVIKDYAEIAALSHVTRARVSQIMNLTLLAPAIQESILFLPRIDAGRDPISLRRLQAIALLADWEMQRKRWRQIS
jgi:hypothetical protein